MKKDTYVDTGTPGIKQNVITKKYVVSLDFGRQLRMNKKTGRMEMKQIKTTRTVSTMKEAKAIQGKNNALKKTRRTTGITRRLHLTKCWMNIRNTIKVHGLIPT